jgi:hypothetical protein
MAIVIGFDIHREQVTFDALDDATGEVQRGRIAPADRLTVRRFLALLPAGRVDVALEATTGWRFIVEEVVAAGAAAHLWLSPRRRPPPWTQGAGEDRSCGCPSPARVVAAGTTA